MFGNWRNLVRRSYSYTSNTPFQVTALRHEKWKLESNEYSKFLKGLVGLTRRQAGGTSLITEINKRSLLVKAKVSAVVY